MPDDPLDLAPDTVPFVTGAELDEARRVRCRRVLGDLRALGFDRLAELLDDDFRLLYGNGAVEPIGILTMTAPKPLPEVGELAAQSKALLECDCCERERRERGRQRRGRK